LNLIYFALQLKEEEDIFEELDEDKYEKLVEERRKTSDFVVDDGKCFGLVWLGVL